MITVLVWLFCGACVERAPACATSDACFALADALAHGDGMIKNEPTALRLFSAICEEGDGDACYNASVLTDDEVLAMRFLERACSAKVMLGCMDLGIALSEANPKRAKELLSKACRGAVGEACAELATTEKDPKKSKAFREAACAFGDEPSCAK